MASMGVKAPADPKGAAARSFMLLEILTASSLLKELREHLHAATGSALLLGHLACLTGRCCPGPTYPPGQPSYLAVVAGERSCQSLQGTGKGDWHMSSSYISMDPSPTTGHDASRPRALHKPFAIRNLLQGEEKQLQFYFSQENHLNQFRYFY